MEISVFMRSTGLDQLVGMGSKVASLTRVLGFP